MATSQSPLFGIEDADRTGYPIRMHLNEPQRQAAQHAEGPLLVFAGAGSGKTRVITYRVANLLARRGVAPHRILCVTFTNKAAGEMRERLISLAGEDVARDLWVGTFHSTCCRLLRRYHDAVGLERSFVIYDDADQKAVVARIIKDMDLDDRRYPPKQVLSGIHARKQEGQRASDLEPTFTFDATCLEVFSRYEQALLRANAVDFDDLILHVMRIAEDPKSVPGQELRGRFDYVLVDEFQDTNSTQYRLLRALAGRTRNLCVVGDDDQSIYSWRGADVRNILGFRKDFPDCLVVKLEQNYRSCGNVVAAALGIIRQAASREPKDLWTEQASGDAIVIRACRDERDEAAHVVATIRRELAEGTAAHDIAIFYRINAQSRVLEEAMRQQNVAYQIIGGMRFFDRAEVKDVIAYLRLVENPRSDMDLLRIVNVPPRGIGNKTVQRLMDAASDAGRTCFDAIAPMLEGGSLGTGPKKKLLAFAQLIDDLRQRATDMTPASLARCIIEETGYRQILRDADTAEADARLENLEELVGSIQEYERECEHLDTPATLHGYLERVSLVADTDQLDDGPRVLLMTVHSAKGLEFDSVFLTGMEEEMFPYRGLDGKSPEEMEEERRLAYVAITRARRRLRITYAGARMIFGQTRYATPSRFLSDIPSECVEHEGASYDTGSSQGWSGRVDPYAYRPGALRRGSESPAVAPGGEESRIDYDVFDDLAYEHQDEEPTLRPQQVKRGGRVFHKRFGRGIVQRIEQGDPPQITARFPGFGERKVLASYLQFE